MRPDEGRTEARPGFGARSRADRDWLCRMESESRTAEHASASPTSAAAAPEEPQPVELSPVESSPANLSPVNLSLAELVGDWSDWAQTAEALGVTVTRVRTLIREHQLAAAVPVKGQGPKVPAAFVQNGEIVKGLSGLITMLHDIGFGDEETIRWIFTDEDLPGRPIDALRENRGSEAKRRAQALA